MHEKLYDKDGHEIGEISVTEDKKIVEIEINGMYWHHDIKSTIKDDSGALIISEKKGEFPVLDIPDWVMEDENEDIVDTEDILDYCVNVAKKNKNAVTEIFNEGGTNIGAIEEGLDYFVQIIIIPIPPGDLWFKMWHYPSQNSGKLGLGNELTIDAMIAPYNEEDWTTPDERKERQAKKEMDK